MKNLQARRDETDALLKSSPPASASFWRAMMRFWALSGRMDYAMSRPVGCVFHCLRQATYARNRATSIERGAR